MQGVPVEVSFGVHREGLHMFDDMHELQKHEGPYKVTGITVQVNDEHVLGVQFHYKDAHGHHHEGHNITKFKPFGSVFGSVHEHTFKIDEDDDLLEVFGFAALRINKLGFRTYRGKEHACGKDHGEPFAYRFPGMTFGAAAGGYGDNLDYLVLRTHPIHAEHRHGLMALIQ